MSLLKSYSKEELIKIAINSNSWRDFSRKLGYNCNSGTLQSTIKKRIKEFNIDVSHFSSVRKKAIKRDVNNIFVENSTATQATLRRWYLKEKNVSYTCSICGLEPIWNDKPLSLILDHINGINNDDRLENLRWVCPNCNMQLPTTNRRKKSGKRYYCIECGTEVSTKKAERCIKCSLNFYKKNIEELPITREELKQLIRVQSFVQIGKIFNVSDNTIRKWCDKLNLPRKASQIKRCTETEWVKI